MAAGGFDLQHAALDSTPEAVNYSLDADDRSLETEYSGAGSTEAAAPAVDSAKIIYTANLTLESKDYEAARSALDSALAEAGGYLESSSEYTRTGSSRSVSLTYRVPQANYQSFLDAVAAAGNVTYRSQQADDVTTQYMDVSARLSKSAGTAHPLTAIAGTSRNYFRTCCRSRTPSPRCSPRSKAGRASWTGTAIRCSSAPCIST